MDGKEIHEVLRRADEALTIQGSYRAPEQARILAARDIVRDAMNDPALSTIDPEAILADDPKERVVADTWSNFEIGMLASMMTGDIEKDWATLAMYLLDETKERESKAMEMFPLQHGPDGDWIIDFDFLMGIQSEFQDGEDYGKPSLETIEEILLVLMRRAAIANAEKHDHGAAEKS